MRGANTSWLVLVLGTVVVLVDALLGLATAGDFTICDVQGCNCTIPAGGWKNVNCFLMDDQELVLQPDHIPKESTEIFITGGRTITFSPKTFNNLQALALLRLDGVKNVVLASKSFYNVHALSLLVQIVNCDDLLIETHAFEDMQGSLSIEVYEARNVKLKESPFSNLSNATFQNVQSMVLDKGAFEIRNLGSIGRHGPVSVVFFVNVRLGLIPSEVFRTSLAQIAFRDSYIEGIGFEAFKSAEMSSVLMVNTTIGRIGRGAFTDRTLVVDFRIIKCSIDQLESKAIMAGMANLTINYSKITDINTKAIVSTVAKVEMTGNEIFNFSPGAVIIQNWNRIVMDQNIIRNLHLDFILPSSGSEVELFSFKGNAIYNAMEGSLSFVQKVDNAKLIFDDNFFNLSCGCDLSEWVFKVTNSTPDYITDTSFCTVDESLSQCFSLPVGIINMRNFTEITCFNNTVCEPYNGETKTINTTGRIFADEDHPEKRTWLIVIVVVISLFILVLLGTFVALMIRGSRWLKRKGYFRNNYYNNNQSNEEENTIVTVETENEKLEIPEELTMEFLHELSRRLDDPNTHQDASEMIERLYEMFIVDESYENNNREEEAHLYEELGNLNLQIPPPPYEEQSSVAIQPSASPRGILKLMEEKFSNDLPQNAKTGSTKTILTSDYSEPLDKDVHLYSELRQKDEAKKESLRSNGSMTMRPLPDKPQAGPSSKM